MAAMDRANNLEDLPVGDDLTLVTVLLCEPGRSLQVARAEVTATLTIQGVAFSTFAYV